MHLSASIGTRKVPMNAAVLRIALSRQGHHVLPQMIEALDAFGQTPPLKNADLDLGHIEPTAMFGRVMHLQSLPDALRFLGRKRLVEAGSGMGVEVVHHQADHPRLGIDRIDRPAAKSCLVRCSVSSAARRLARGSTNTNRLAAPKRSYSASERCAYPGFTGSGSRTSPCTISGFSSKQTKGVAGSYG